MDRGVVVSASEAKQQAYYDDIAATYDVHYGSDNNIAYRARVYDQLLGTWKLRGMRVLDAMCGGGQNSAYFIGKGADVTGIDISSKQCEHYQRRFPDSQVICGSALDTGLADASIDLVFTDSLHHLHPHVDRGVREFARVLKPGGHMLVWEPAAKSIIDRARKLWYRLDRKYFEDNEASIDINRLARDHAKLLNLENALYGGNIAYLFVVLSMALRIPVGLVDRYASAAFWLEDKLTPLQGESTSMWVLALLRKAAL
jgi:ubiquinone/menaquinone biosynthesis C-methylase UbiE